MTLPGSTKDWAGGGTAPPGRRTQESVGRKGPHAHHKQRHELPAHRLRAKPCSPPRTFRTGENQCPALRPWP